MSRQVHVLEIGALRRELPLFQVKPGLSIAVLNILGDVELVEAAAEELAPRIKSINPGALVTPEAKSIPLAYALAARLQLPYVVLRKSYKSYMGDALSVRTHSITTGTQQSLYLDEKDRQLIHDAPIALVDDVVSTGSTLNAMRSLMQRANARVVAETAICTEGNPQEWPDVIALGHLPLFTDDA
ncbi:MAG: phosphoribosyltransferase family protein [Gammaproteobacteria bacterium]